MNSMANQQLLEHPKVFEVGQVVVRRGSIHHKSKSYALWRVLHVLQTTIPCIEVAPITKKGRLMVARKGVYVAQQFDPATSEEIQAGHRICKRLLCGN